MLSQKQQNFLSELLILKILRTKECLEEHDLYKNRMSFYRSIKYLRDANLINATKENKKYIFELTLKGEIMARILLSLPDVPEEKKEFALSLYKNSKEVDINKLLKRGKINVTA